MEHVSPIVGQTERLRYLKIVPSDSCNTTMRMTILSVAFHPHGTFQMSSSNDGTLKIWDLRKVHILYTLTGYTGSTSAGTFSPGGDYFCFGGKDSTVMIMKGRSSCLPDRVIQGVTKTILETEIFVTD